MPANPKRAVDWHRIRQRYGLGATAYALAKDYPVTRQAIEKRARKEGWQRTDAGIVQAACATPTANRIANPATRSDKLLAAFGKRTAENAALIVEDVRNGVPESVAARGVGIDPETLRLWKRDDPMLNAMIESARAQVVRARIGNVLAAGDRGDVRADMWYLERNRMTRDEFGDRGKGREGSNLIVHVNVQRAAVDGVKHAQVIEMKHPAGGGSSSREITDVKPE